MATSAPTFLFKIEEIWPTVETMDEFGNWIPPDRMSGQFRSSTATQVYRWNASNIQTVTSVPPPLPAGCSIYKQVTMYHCNGRFWVVPYDATQWNVYQVPSDVDPWLPGWRALKFDHCAEGVSSVGFELPHSRLAVQRPNNTWRPQLFPDGYSVIQSNNQPGGLQGNLALILALGAFSAPRGQMATAIATSFKPGQWVPHSLGSGREDGRGFVVTVYVEPPFTADHLRAFEDGHYGGPIFA